MIALGDAYSLVPPREEPLIIIVLSYRYMPVSKDIEKRGVNLKYFLRIDKISYLLLHRTLCLPCINLN